MSARRTAWRHGPLALVRSRWDTLDDAPAPYTPEDEPEWFYLFVSVRDRRLRAFNRLQLMENIFRFMGVKAARKYIEDIEALGSGELNEVRKMERRVRAAGFDALRRQLKFRTN